MEPPIIDFTLEGLPIAQPRAQRHVRRTRDGSILMKDGRPVMGAHQPRVKRLGQWAPHPIVAYRRGLELMGRMAWRQPPMENVGFVMLEFVFPRSARLRAGGDREPHRVKPDSTNLVKGVEDALNGVLWRDDCTIFLGPLPLKFYAAAGEPPHTRVRVWDSTADVNLNIEAELRI